jgi:hypothetical protein
VIFHCYVSSPEGMQTHFFWPCFVGFLFERVLLAVYDPHEQQAVKVDTFKVSTTQSACWETIIRRAVSYIYRRIKRGILKGTNPLCISKGTRKSHPILRGTEVWRYPNWLSITSLIWLGILHGFIYCSKHVESISVKICGSKGPKEIKTKYRILIVHDVHRQQAESDWTVISLEKLRSEIPKVSPSFGSAVCTALLVSHDFQPVLSGSRCLKVLFTRPQELWMDVSSSHPEKMG